MADIPGLSAFLREGWKQAGRDSLGWTGATDEDIAELASERSLRAMLGNEVIQAFIAREDRSVVGICVNRKKDAETMELAGIIVLAKEVGKGIGSGLFDLAREGARSSGAKRMMVKTETFNERALSFYRGKGFVPAGVVVEQVGGSKVSCSLLFLDL
jgi:GNAT superfamily N-acetyltransferase